MAIKVNARETELKFGKEATYHSAMIWKMKQIRRFLRHKKGTQIPWITQILLIDNCLYSQKICATRAICVTKRNTPHGNNYQLSTFVAARAESSVLELCRVAPKPQRS